MNRGVTFSRRRAWGCAAMCVVAACAAASHHRAARDRFVANARQRALEAQLAIRIEGLAAFSDANLERRRGELAGARAQMSGQSEWEGFLRAVPTTWRVEAGVPSERGSYAVSRTTLSLVSPEPSDWPAVVDLVGSLEQVRGARVSRFEMRTRGDRQLRSVESVEVAAEVILYRSDPPSPL